MGGLFRVRGMDGVDEKEKKEMRDGRSIRLDEVKRLVRKGGRVGKVLLRKVEEYTGEGWKIGRSIKKIFRLFYPFEGLSD